MPYVEKTYWHIKPSLTYLALINMLKEIKIILKMIIWHLFWQCDNILIKFQR